jgi:hypothetical protein
VDGQIEVEWRRLVPAHEFAVAWLAASLAWDRKDRGRPETFRALTLSIDLGPDADVWAPSVLTATDGFRAARVQVMDPDDRDMFKAGPGVMPARPLSPLLTVAPVDGGRGSASWTQVLVSDVNLRVSELCKWVAKETAKDADAVGAEPVLPWLELSFGRRRDVSAPRLDDSLDDAVLVVEVPGSERVTVDVLPTPVSWANTLDGAFRRPPVAHRDVVLNPAFAADAARFAQRLGGAMRVTTLGAKGGGDGVPEQPNAWLVKVPGGWPLGEMLVMPVLQLDEVDR